MLSLLAYETGLSARSDVERLGFLTDIISAAEHGLGDELG